MRLYDIIIVTIANFFGVNIIRRFIIIFFPENKADKKIELSAYLLFYIVMLLAFLFFHSRYLNVIINIVGMFALSCLYKGNNSKKISIALMIYIILMGCELVS